LPSLSRSKSLLQYGRTASRFSLPCSAKASAERHARGLDTLG
jgi:hypothetical protein